MLVLPRLTNRIRAPSQYGALCSRIYSSRLVVRPLHSNSSPLRTSLSLSDNGSDLGASGISSSEMTFLQGLIERSPLFLHPSGEETKTKTGTETGVYQFPLGTTFKVPSRKLGLEMRDLFAYGLKRHGIIAIELAFKDPESRFLVEIVQAMGFVPDTHSDTQGVLWDVTYKPEGVLSKKTGAYAHSRSHSLGEFSWHTDGAFETDPQRYFGFHVIHPDKMGGGVFRILDVAELVKLLSPSSVKSLVNHEFDIQVPPEFYKGVAFNKGKLLFIDPETGNHHVRYRRDTLADPPSNDEAANSAVAELSALLERPESVGQAMPARVFKENCILLMDNARFLHCRTEIKDPRRLLRRIRFRDTAVGA